MLTKYDEYPCHQIVSTFDHVDTSAREWAERVIMHTHDVSGKYHLTCGIGWYQNRNVIDAFACFAVEGKKQYVVRASRELRSPADDCTIGPFSYAILEPLKMIRYTLGDNQYDLSYDIEFEGTMQCHEEEPQHARSRGRVVEHVVRYDQAGRASGWIKAGGHTIQLDKQEWFVERDHAWGIRRGGADALEAAVQPREIPPGQLYSWAVIQFEKWGAAYHIRETWDEKLRCTRKWHFSGGIFYPCGSDKEELELTDMEHDFKLRQENRQIEGGELKLKAIDGTTRELSLQPLSACHLRVAGYGATEGFAHGVWMGPEFLDGLKLDLKAPDVANQQFDLRNTACE